MHEGYIYSIAISAQRGELKHEVESAIFIENFGIEGDGHAGDWGRQVTLLSYESVQRVNKEHNLAMKAGDFAENVLISGVDVSQLHPGSRLQLGDDVVLEITQIGKEDHPSVVTRTFGVSLLPYEGLFCKVIHGGTVKKGDFVHLL